MVSQSEGNAGPRIVVVVVVVVAVGIVLAAVAACCIVWELEAEAQLVANMAKGYQVAPCGLVDAGEGTRILFLSYGEVYIPPDGSHGRCNRSAGHGYVGVDVSKTLYIDAEVRARSSI